MVITSLLLIGICYYIRAILSVKYQTHWFLIAYQLVKTKLKQKFVLINFLNNLLKSQKCQLFKKITI